MIFLGHPRANQEGKADAFLVAEGFSLNILAWQVCQKHWLES